ncbi:unnamed protein product [Brachionus calyciflorus]|uniref:Uncharacterized protein n=1 Tax=Brachionus calyciflorus TaxID=104777 RepID=A0A813MM20_9BILA|nr:unnamed protein product [Brachionus calyciflorus]
MYFEILKNFGKNLHQYSNEVKNIPNIDDEIKKKIAKDASFIYKKAMIIGLTYKSNISSHDPSDDLSNQNIENKTIFQNFIRTMFQYYGLLSSNKNLEESLQKRLLYHSKVLIGQLMEMSKIVRQSESKETTETVNELNTKKEKLKVD